MFPPFSPPKNLRRVLPWIGAALSGILLALCFAPWHCPNLVWFALIPLLWAVWSGPESPSATRTASLGATTGLVFYTSCFYWLSELGPLFEAPALNGLPLLLGGYLALYPALWTVLIANPPARVESHIAQSLMHVIFALRGAGAWVALEWVRGWFLGGFGWNSLGVALHENLALIQIADLFGAHGLTFLVTYANLIAALLIRNFQPSIQNIPRIRVEIMSVLVLVGLSVSYGIRCVVRPGPGPTIPLRAISLQPNIPQTQKFDPDQEETLLGTLERLSGMAAAIKANPDLVLWPEAAIPRGIFAEQEYKRFVFAQIQRIGAPLLLGSLEPAAVASGTLNPGESGIYNSALLLSGQPPALQSAQKRHLVPFGEFLPFRDWLPGLIQELVPGDITPGTEVRLLHLPQPAIRIGALVCFEDSLSRETRDMARAGAQILVNITNDAWFGTSSAAYQHFANARLRAVETRLPLLRCTNTGLTCAVDSLGRTESHLAPFTEGLDTFNIQVPVSPLPTIYTRFGDLWIAACGLNAIALFIRRRRHAAQKATPHNHSPGTHPPGM